MTSVSPWYVVRLHGLYAFGWTLLIAFQERLLTLCPLCTGDPIMAAGAPIMAAQIGINAPLARVMG